MPPARELPGRPSAVEEVRWLVVRRLVVERNGVLSVTGPTKVRGARPGGPQSKVAVSSAAAFSSRDLSRPSKHFRHTRKVSSSLTISIPVTRVCTSHETIYRSLFIQARGVLKKELIQHLRTKRRIRRSRHARDRGHHCGQIVDAISIRERPAEIEDRAIPGHWEGDLLRGTNNSHIATLVERHSRFTTLVKVPSKDTAAVVAALSRHVRKLPVSLRRSLTRDRGLEMAQHKSLTVATNVKVHFCDPQSPWQRGTNENTNGLLRQYFPKRTDLSGHTQAELDKVALRLNQRPRKTLGFETPADRLQASLDVATTH
jgi:IS30 family transposase